MDVEQGTWAEQTRRVLTRDLVVRARHAAPGERRSLEFRTLHLNLPLVREVADELGVTDAERAAVEHAALDELYEAVRRFDPWDHHDFAVFAAPLVRARMLRQLARGGRRTAFTRSLPQRIPGREARRPASVPQGRLVRLAVLRAAQAMAGYRL